MILSYVENNSAGNGVHVEFSKGAKGGRISECFGDDGVTVMLEARD